MKILFIGDVFAQTGQRAVKELLSKIKSDYHIDYTIANAENATGCRGLSKKDYQSLSDSGVDFFTMGNHTWNNQDIFELLSTKKNIIRPLNIAKEHCYCRSGVGSKILYVGDVKVRITSLIGESIKLRNVQITNPFIELQSLIANSDEVDFHIVDFHAETTSEKNALFYEFNGKVEAIVGTHTHIQTADNRIKNNTAFITDVGSTGPINGVIGAKGEFVVKKFLDNSNKFILEEEGGEYQFCGVVIEYNKLEKKVKSIERILIYE